MWEFSMQTAEANTLREVADARLAVYRLLLAALSKPTPDQHAWLLRSEFRRALELVGDQFGPPCPVGEVAPDEYADYESRYIACFEVGVPAPPVALQASAYNRREPVPAVIHEHVLFYKRFGLRLPEDNIEPADHLLNELAFLIHLDELLRMNRIDAGSLLLARRDFLQRQVARWVSRAAADAEDKRLPAIYCRLLALLAHAVQHDLELTQEAIPLPPEGKP
jgi:DMSO reductase family type II enzyme chaperone